MPRRNFTKKTKRDALFRAGACCEAIGAWYGLEPGQRCNAPLDAGVEFDHIDLDANSKDNSLSNCAAVCIKCHAFKTRRHDTPKAAKTVRQQDKDRGIKSESKRPLKSRNTFPQAKAKGEKLPVPGPRNLFQEQR